MRFLLGVMLGAMLLCQPVTLKAQGPSSMSESELRADAAQAWAALVLKGIDREFPNKPSVVLADAASLATPREMFPAFFGCFDWHSSVHGHWLLVRALRLFPKMENADQIRAALDAHLAAANIQAEADFFSKEEHKSFERMYGWAWYLRLVTELEQWDDPLALQWRANLKPLEIVLVARITEYLPKLEYPIRTGEHPDTGFALGQILDYARATNQSELADLVIDRARKYYLADRDYPVQYEPSGQDFFSSGWNEADLMRRVLSAQEFAGWLDQFLPQLEAQLVDGTIQSVEVTDQSDGKLVHLAGLNLNRAWCLRSVALYLDDSSSLRQRLLDQAAAHLEAGLKYVNSGHYEGDHWLATFAMYASTMPGGESREKPKNQ